MNALVDIHVEDIGVGRPLVFVHGWRLDSTAEMSDFEERLPELQSWRRIYIDLPGMGQSAVRPELRTLSDYAQWLHTALRSLVPDRFAVAATSTGVPLVLSAIEHDVERVQGLLLRMPRMTANDGARDISRVQLPGASVQQRIAKQHAVWQPAEARRSQHVQDLRDDDARYELRVPTYVVDVPALVIAGRQDSRVGYRDAVALLDRLPRGTLAVVDGAEHDYPYADRDLFRALVADWLKRVELRWNATSPADGRDQ